VCVCFFFSTMLMKVFVLSLLVASFGLDDVHKDMVTIVCDKGYPIEQHFVETEDGYILGVFRIPYGRNESISSLNLHKPVVFLQHGLLDSSYTWVNNYPNQSLAFILADHGYDVWLGNNRGNTFSQRHVKYLKNSQEFWDFSYDEMAQYDVPNMIDYVLDYTNHEKLAYVGHSEGTTQMFAAPTFNSNINDKIAIYGALAPVAYVHHCKSTLIDLMSYMNIAVYFEIFGVKQFLPGVVINTIAPHLCNSIPNGCDSFLILLCGPTHDINASRIGVYVSETPADTSVKNMGHWAQGVKKQKFEMFDYGTKEKNQEHYHRNEPPQYDLSKLTMPIAIYSGKYDYLGDPEDLKQLINELNPNIIVGKTVVESFAHLDFTWGAHANEFVYYPLMKQIEQYLAPGVTLSKIDTRRC